jgi:hypothetical protein
MANRILTTTALTLLLAGCTTGTEGNGDPDTTPDAPETADLELTFSGLDLLAEGYVYEGWIMVDGAPVTAGRFSVDEADSSHVFELDAADLESATAYILTIEPEPDADPAPSAVHILAGDLVDGVADLDTAHPAAIGTDFMDAAGSYILETPSSAGVADDYDQGIWWIELGANGPMPILELPELPAGWTYEGWVVVDGEPISTGTFNYGDEADSDGAGATAGPDGTPPFPGQDFVDPALVLTGGLAVISVEPVPDTSAAPFAIKPLVDMEIEDLVDHELQAMDNNAASAPIGMASVHSMSNM